MNGLNVELEAAEKRLEDIVHQETVAMLESSNLYKHLNDKKITPVFLKMFKNKQTTNTSLDQICRDDGTIFNVNLDRDTYIMEYFKNIYKLPQNYRAPAQDSIANYLGPDVLNHRIVTASKLTELERIRLDRPLDLSELDKP